MKKQKPTRRIEPIVKKALFVFPEYFSSEQFFKIKSILDPPPGFSLGERLAEAIRAYHGISKLDWEGPITVSKAGNRNRIALNRQLQIAAAELAEHKVLDKATHNVKAKDKTKAKARAKTKEAVKAEIDTARRAAEREAKKHPIKKSKYDDVILGLEGMLEGLRHEEVMIELLSNDSAAFEDLERLITGLHLKATIARKEIPSGKVGPKYKFAYRSYCKDLIDIFEGASGVPAFATWSPYTEGPSGRAIDFLHACFKLIDAKISRERVYTLLKEARDR